MPTEKSLTKLNKKIYACQKCPRLVEWREQTAEKKVRRFLEWSYWGKPVGGFGEPDAWLWIIGLAPAAHGGNRTGRVFTGDRSGDWLFRALHKAGFANQPQSVSREDGLVLNDCYISAVVRCAPPANKPLPQEYRNCRSFLLDEFRLLKNLRVMFCLGQIAFRQTLNMLEKAELFSFKPKPKFGHGLVFPLTANLRIVTSYHPSQQNTFTGRLTEKMLDQVFLKIKEK